MVTDPQDRLAAFEKMLDDTQKNCAEFAARMDKLKAEGKEKTATFRQYWSNKMTCQYMLSTYKSYGLVDEETLKERGINL